jgi:DNA polymerase III psi subunit
MDIDGFIQEIEKVMVNTFSIQAEIVKDEFNKDYREKAIKDLQSDNSFRRALWQVLQ